MFDSFILSAVLLCNELNSDSRSFRNDLSSISAFMRACAGSSEATNTIQALAVLNSLGADRCIAFLQYQYKNPPEMIHMADVLGQI